MTIEQIVEGTNFDQVDLDPSQLEFKTNVSSGKFVMSGYFLKGTETQAGIGRKEVKDSGIWEGFFQNGKLNGFGRLIIGDGTFYDIGEHKNYVLHGKGKRVFSDGRILEGRWEEGKFKGAE